MKRHYQVFETWSYEKEELNNLHNLTTQEILYQYKDIFFVHNDALKDWNDQYEEISSMLQAVYTASNDIIYLAHVHYFFSGDSNELQIGNKNVPTDHKYYDITSLSGEQIIIRDWNFDYFHEKMKESTLILYVPYPKHANGKIFVSFA